MNALSAVEVRRPRRGPSWPFVKDFPLHTHMDLSSGHVCALVTSKYTRYVGVKPIHTAPFLLQLPLNVLSLNAVTFWGIEC